MMCIAALSLPKSFQWYRTPGICIILCSCLVGVLVEFFGSRKNAQAQLAHTIWDHPPRQQCKVFEELREKHDWMLVPLGKWLMTCWWLGRVLSCLKLRYHYINNKPIQWARVELFLPWWDDHLLSEMIIHVDVAPLLNLLSTPAFHMSDMFLNFQFPRRHAWDWYSSHYGSMGLVYLPTVGWFLWYM